jgi:hypothetical protein
LGVFVPYEVYQSRILMMNPTPLRLSQKLLPVQKGDASNTF